MWRNIIKTFERSLILNTQKVAYKSNSVNSPKQRFLVCSAVLRNVETVDAAQAGIIEGDTEYIIPYRAELERCDINSKKFLETLRSRFSLNKEEVERIMNDEVVLKNYRQKPLMETMELLCSEWVTKENFVEYPWLITLDKRKLEEKLNLLKSLNGLRDINDFVPFLRLQIPRLRKLVSSLNRETNMKHGNRVYFLAEQLNVLPRVVTKYLAKRLFVLEIPLEMFEKNLQNMINYNVEPMNILKDLWGFRYAPGAVELRLKRAAQAKKVKIMPWMVRCPEPILQKSLQLSLDELEVLGKKSTVAEYVGERLGFSAEEAQVIMDRHPQVNSVRVTKIKEVLDYLLDEAKFTRYEIGQVPRILCHSLDTTKQRIEELKKYGCRPSSLIIVCRSKREYEKFIEQWKQSYKFNKTVEDVKNEE